DGKWTAVHAPSFTDLQKRPGLQGPIDDAFTDAFVCVTGAGKPWHESTNKAAQAELVRFRRNWDIFLRAALPVVADKELTEADTASKTLVLFGDPSSNAVLAKVIDKLPLKWSAETIEFAGRKYDAATHLPALIYPNPLNPKKYVVINTGHTFHEAEFKG